MTTLASPSLTAVLAAPGPIRLDRSWWSWAGPHGGLLAALALRSAGRLAGAGRTARALSAQLLRTVDDAPLHASAELVREGGSSSTVASALRDDEGALVVTAVLTSGRARWSGVPYAAVPMPSVAGPESCDRLVLPADLVPFSARLEFRPATPALPLTPGPLAELVAWVRFHDDEPLDAAALTVVADAMPPALYAVTATPVPVPTVELTASYAAGLDEAPLRGWVLVRIATRTAGDGWAVDDSDVWAPDGRLLVQSRQTRRVLGELVR